MSVASSGHLDTLSALDFELLAIVDTVTEASSSLTPSVSLEDLTDFVVFFSLQALLATVAG